MRIKAAPSPMISEPSQSHLPDPWLTGFLYRLTIVGGFVLIAVVVIWELLLLALAVWVFVSFAEDPWYYGLLYAGLSWLAGQIVGTIVFWAAIFVLRFLRWLLFGAELE